LYTITLLSKTDDGYKLEMADYESVMELVHDSSSYRERVISYYDSDYMSTKIGSLLSLYGSTVGSAISVVMMIMFKKDLIMKFIQDYNEDDNSPAQEKGRLE